MCIIVDANKLADFATQNDEESLYLHKTLDAKRTQLIFGGKLYIEEYQNKAPQHCRIIKRLWQSGKAVRIDDDRVNEEEQTIISQGGYQSDDPHVLALARISGARLLFTKDDALMDDFRDRRLINPKGKIYGGSQQGSKDYIGLLVRSCSYRKCRQCKKK